MKHNLAIALLLMVWALPTQAQRVWLDEDLDFYDPDHPVSVRYAYYDLPLPQDGDHYRLIVKLPEGKPVLESWSPTPEWEGQLFVGEYIRRYEDGAIQLTGHYERRKNPCQCGGEQSVRHGLFTEYHPNGQVRLAMRFEDNERADGDYVEYDPEGRPVDEFSLKDGRFHGPRRNYEQGVLVDQGHFRSGRREGAQKTFYTNGNLKRSWTETHFGDYIVQTEGPDVYYREDGSKARVIDRTLNSEGRTIKTVTERFHANGELESLTIDEDEYELVERFNDEGELVGREETRDGVREGLYLGRDWHGLEKTHYRNGLRQGPSVIRQSDGSREEGRWVDDEKDGLWLTVDGDGSRQEERYRAGELHGLQQRFNADGERIAFRNFRHGTLHGSADWVDDYGEREVADYLNGEREGEFRRYSASGVLLEQGHYVNGEPDGAYYLFAEDGRMAEKRVYRQGVAHGDWLHTDSEGRPQLRRSFENGELVGEILLEAEASDSQYLFSQ